MKNQHMQVDVYDLATQRDQATQMTQIGFRIKQDSGVDTEPFRQLLSGRDWYFSDLNR